jgi:hypothetical protein
MTGEEKELSKSIATRYLNANEKRLRWIIMKRTLGYSLKHSPIWTRTAEYVGTHDGDLLRNWRRDFKIRFRQVWSSSTEFTFRPSHAGKKFTLPNVPVRGKTGGVLRVPEDAYLPPYGTPIEPRPPFPS